MPTFQTQTKTIEFHDTGTGLPVIIVPGISGKASWYERLAHGLEPRYRSICLELGDCKSAPNKAIEETALDIRALLAHLRLPGAVVVGHGFGAMAGLYLAAKYPENVICLVTASAGANTSGTSVTEVLSERMPANVDLSSPFMRFVNSIFRKSVNERTGEEDIAELGEIIEPNDINNIKKRAKALVETDLTQHLSNIVTPTLVVAGSCEKPYVLDSCQKTELALEHGTLEIMEGLDYFFFHRDYKPFERLLHAFICEKADPL